MSMFVHGDASPGKGGGRKTYSVPAPNAHAGIASALKASYATLPIDEQLHRLLDRIK